MLKKILPILPDSSTLINQWVWNNAWLSVLSLNEVLHWHTSTTRPLPTGTSIGSLLNGHGDGPNNSVYPGYNSWIWIDKNTQNIWHSNATFDVILHTTPAYHRSGDGLWLNDHTVIWIEENTLSGIWSIWQADLLHQTITQRWQDTRVIASLTSYQDTIGFITWDASDMPWDASIWQTLDHNNHHRIIPLPTCAWSQPVVFQDELYLIGSLDDRRAIYHISNDTATRVTPYEHDVGEIEWVRNRQDYCIYKNSIYYAHQYAGLWSWSSIINNEHKSYHLPWLQHDRWLRTKTEPLILGSSLTQTGYCDLHGNIHAQPIKNPLPPWSSRTDTLPNGNYSQTWMQSGQGDVQGTILWLHGGPADVSRPRYHPQTQLYCEHGWDVYHINVIGSSGFGKIFRNKLYHIWGPGDAYDIEQTVTIWREENFLRGDKLIVHARSSSGWTALHFGSSLQADAFIFYYPVVDINATLASNEPFEKGYIKRLIGTQDTKTTPPSKPIYIFQGQSDSVVPWNSVEQWWQDNTFHPQSQIEYLPNEGHGFSSSLRKDIILKEIRWLDSLWSHKKGI